MHTLDQFFSDLIAQPFWHARWLNTVSYLEYIGARKIIKSQNAEKIDITLLEHIAEEARHAFFVKKIANKMFPGECPSYEPKYLMAGEFAEKYIQTLDCEIEGQLIISEVENLSQLAYLYVTQLIELRALEVYHAYEKAVVEAELPIRVRSVLVEEDKHLQETESLLKKIDPSFQSRMQSFHEIEKRLFDELFSEMCELLKEGKVRSVSKSAPVAHVEGVKSHRSSEIAPLSLDSIRTELSKVQLEVTV